MQQNAFKTSFCYHKNEFRGIGDKQKSELIRLCIIFFFFLVFLFICYFYFQNYNTYFPLPSVIKKAFIPQTLTVERIFRNDDREWIATLSAKRIRVLITTGDVIPARSVNSQAVQRKNFKWSFEKTAQVLSSADVTFINLESPFIKNCPITSEGMIFCGDSRNVEGLVLAGVDVANFANNHMGNYGKNGIEETVNSVSGNGILPSGVSGPVFYNVKGKSFAFLGYNDVGHKEEMISWADENLIRSEISQARGQADVVVVAFHWGVEYVAEPTKRQAELAHLAIDSGADLIIGNHPHWVQPVEVYKDKLIVYAHGNFVFDQMWSEKTKEGVIGKYTFYDNRLVDAEFLPIKIKDYGAVFFARF